MLKEIQSLIDKQEYEKALEIIDLELSRIRDFQTNEKLYTNLLQLRVSVKQKLGEVDAIIRDKVRSDIFPSETTHIINGKFKITLIFKGAFLEKCDAYVNTVHIEKPFREESERSSINEFVKKLGGIEATEKQVKGQLPKEEGDFIVLQHKALSAPMSYHILFYSQSNDNIDLLEKGIKKVLDDACKNKLSKLSFFPLGFDLVRRVSDQNEQKLIAEKIADKTAEIIIRYINENNNKAIPEIVCNFVTVSTMIAFEKAFNKWAGFDKNYFAAIKQIEAKQKALIDASLTRDKEYIEKLKDLTSSIDDESPILILGETGVGKSFLAKLIHSNSKRPQNLFKQMNCSLIKSDRIYTMLFGWGKGTFTGAINDGKGAIGGAEGGTLFLDEIGYADLEVQEMLLKFVEEKKYSRFGEQENELTADVKLILGTNVDIKKNIDNGTFANDLYERICKNEITIPPLRERKDDIPLIVDRILKNLNDNNNIKVEILETAMETLKSFNWPGNIRQLQSYIEKTVQKVRKEKVNIIIPKLITENPPRNDLKAKNTLKELEENLLEYLKSWDADNGNLLDGLILPVLSKVYANDFNGNIKESSKLIGIDGTRGKDSTLSKNLEKYRELIKKKILG